MVAANLAAWVGNLVFGDKFSKHTAYLIPVLAFSIPMIQFYLFQQSSRLGAVYGPLVTEILTYFPLVLLSLLCAASLMGLLNRRNISEPLWSAGSGVATYAVFIGAQQVSTSLIKTRIGSSLLFTRSGLQFVLATCYAIFLPSRLTLLAILPFLHLVTFNVHVPLEHTTALLNETLRLNGYNLVARQESLTGYISVLDNINDGFRVMRCDHSLLGGEWLLPPGNIQTGLREPIYAVFVMLEAVRLVQPVNHKGGTTGRDIQKTALVMYAFTLSLWMCWVLTKLAQRVRYWHNTCGAHGAWHQYNNH